MKNEENKMTTVDFCYYLKGFSNCEYECTLYLNEAECLIVRELLASNKEAKFKDLPAELYQAFQDAAEHAALELGKFPELGKETGIFVELQQDMPEDLIDLQNDEVWEHEDMTQYIPDDLGAPLKENSTSENNHVVELSVRELNSPRKSLLEKIVKGKINCIEVPIIPDNEVESILLDEPDEDGICYPTEDENGECIPVKYDAIKLYAGNNNDAEYVLVEVKKIFVESVCDENGYPVYLEEFGKDYLAENVVYELGSVIETTLIPKKPSEGPYMKCLAVRQPWAQLIVTGIKDIECRNAMPAPIQKVFIAASGTKLRWDELGAEVQKVYHNYQAKGVLPPYDELPTKCIVGHVDIVKSSIDPVDSPWGRTWPGMKYTLHNAEVLDEPIYGMNKATPYFYNVEGYDETHLPKSHKAKL